MGVPQTDSFSDDARLVARTLSGDQGAFRQLFESHAPFVHRLAIRMLGDAEDAADLTQEIFVRAYERLRSMRDGQAFRAWLTRLAVNMAHDRLRRRRMPTVSLDCPPPGREEGAEWTLADEGLDTEARLLREELARQVQQALQALSADHRLVVALHHLEGLPVDEIATTLGVPIGTVKSRLSRARVELRRLLSAYVEE